jgi:hypothetical protein
MLPDTRLQAHLLGGCGLGCQQAHGVVLLFFCDWEMIGVTALLMERKDTGVYCAPIMCQVLCWELPCDLFSTSQ